MKRSGRRIKACAGERRDYSKSKKTMDTNLRDTGEREDRNVGSGAGNHFCDDK